MDTIKILIADTNEDFRSALSQTLSSCYCVRTCSDGADAERQLLQFRPDIFVLDLLLPCRDGLYLLGVATSLPKPAQIVIISRFISDYARAQAVALNVQWMMSKPCDLMKAVEHIRDLAKTLDHDPTEHDCALVSKVLLELGFQSHRAGFKHLKNVIPLFAKDTSQPINKVVYSRAAEPDHGSSPKSVEKAIRDAIQAAWAAGDRDRWSALFPQTRKAPSNKEFISRIVELIKSQEEGAVSLK